MDNRTSCRGRVIPADTRISQPRFDERLRGEVGRVMLVNYYISERPGYRRSCRGTYHQRDRAT